MNNGRLAAGGAEEKSEDLAAARYWFGFAVPHRFNYGSICFFRQSR
jgi:hypothetical protein